jgi:His Kinase A (phospho-acceptor) domain
MEPGSARRGAFTGRRTARSHARGAFGNQDGAAPPAMIGGFELATPGTSLELLSSIAHEIRTPVTALATATELIREDLHHMDRDELLRMVETMHRGAIWLQGLVENLLCAATLSEGRLRISQRRLALGELARDVVAVVEPLLQQRGQWVRVVERRDVGEVLADGRRIGQALINLLVNASKHGQPGTRIDLLILRRADCVRVSVADRGRACRRRAQRRSLGPSRAAARPTARASTGWAWGSPSCGPSWSFTAELSEPVTEEGAEPFSGLRSRSHRRSDTSLS